MKNIWNKLLFMCVLVVLIAGCGKQTVADEQTISNAIISIRQYKGLEVEESQDGEILEEYVWDALLKNCTVKEYPNEELTELIGNLEKEYSYVAYYQDKTAEELIEEIHGVTAEELAKEQLKKKYAVALIAEKENLTLTTEEYQKELEKRSTANGIESASEYENMFGKTELVEDILEERVLEVLMEYMKTN